MDKQWVIVHDDPNGLFPFLYVEFAETDSQYIIEGQRLLNEATIITDKLKQEYDRHGLLFQDIEEKGLNNPRWKEVGVMVIDVVNTLSQLLLSSKNNPSKEMTEFIQKKLFEELGVPKGLLKATESNYTKGQVTNND